jgi:hypothetical protein
LAVGDLNKVVVLGVLQIRRSLYGGNYQSTPKNHQSLFYKDWILVMLMILNTDFFP